eukprot:m.16834 g.16834  ORF g.16834 m.16834 type:complete len:71 (+) comp4676_c0_seq2:66-278(+)
MSTCCMMGFCDCVIALNFNPYKSSQSTILLLYSHFFTFSLMELNHFIFSLPPSLSLSHSNDGFLKRATNF